MIWENDEMTPQEIDKIVCEWSMEFGIAMTEEALNSLVDRLALAAATDPDQAKMLVTFLTQDSEPYPDHDGVVFTVALLSAGLTIFQSKKDRVRWAREIQLAFYALRHLPVYKHLGPERVEGRIR